MADLRNKIAAPGDLPTHKAKNELERMNKMLNKHQDELDKKWQKKALLDE